MAPVAKIEAVTLVAESGFVLISSKLLHEAMMEPAKRHAMYLFSFIFIFYLKIEFNIESYVTNRRGV